MRFPILPALFTALTTFIGTAAIAEEGHEDHAGHDHAAHAEHDHPTEGPRGGSLLELGDEEYHAELLLDEKTSQVTVVLLDSTATQDVAIDTPNLLVNVKARNPRQYKLAPLYAEGHTPTGPTAMFALVSPELMADLHAHDVVAKLNVFVGKKSYTATLHHDHDHAGHDH